MGLNWAPEETPVCDPTPTPLVYEVVDYREPRAGELYLEKRGAELKTDPLPVTRGDRWVDYALIIGCLILMRVVWGIFAGVFPLD